MKIVKEGGEILLAKDDGDFYSISNVGDVLLYEILLELKEIRCEIAKSKEKDLK